MATVPIKNSQHADHAAFAKQLLRQPENVLQNALAPKKNAKPVEPTQESALLNFCFCSPSYAFSPAARQAVFCVPSLFVIPFTCLLVNTHANMQKTILAFETL